VLSLCGGGRRAAEAGRGEEIGVTALQLATCSLETSWVRHLLIERGTIGVVGLIFIGDDGCEHS
jgi:hypothetical protein